MGRTWKAVASRLPDEEREQRILALLMRPRVHHAAQAVDTLLAALTDASDRAMIGGIGPLKAAWRRSVLPAVSKP
jgi:hypothetical protein